MKRLTAPIAILLFFSTISANILFALLVVKPLPAHAEEIAKCVLFDPAILFPVTTPLQPPADPGSLTAVPVHDVGAIGNTAITAGAARTTVKQDCFEWLMRFIRETLRKQLLDMIVGQIINWIQGGGSPKFVTDWQGFLADAGNIAAGQFAEEIGLGFLCKPFALQIGLAFGIGMGGRTFSQRISCTLDDIVGNINNFYNNFGNGGWPAYQRMLQPQNNVYGAYLVGYTRLVSLQGRYNNAALAEAQAGGGFLSTKQCQEAFGPWPQGASGRGIDDLDGDGIKGDIASTCKITTPGQTIGAITSKAVGADIDYILNAQELEAYVSAIADALINRLVLEGAKGLAGVSNSSSPNGGSIPRGTSGCAGLTGSARTSCQGYLNPTNLGVPLPTRPTGLNANAVSPATATSTPTIRLTWNDNATTETGYIVERSLDFVTGFYPIAYNLPANTSSYTDSSSLQRNTRYYYRVRAINGTGSSDPSNVADERAQ